MARTKTSLKQAKSLKSTQQLKLKPGASVISYSPTEEPLHEDFYWQGYFRVLKK